MGIFHWLESKCQLGGFYMTLLMHFSHQFFSIKGSCFQMYRVYLYLKLIYYLWGKNIQVLSLYSQIHMHHIITHFTWCNLFVSNQTSVGHFSFIYFFINLTFVMCNCPQASCSCVKPMNYFVINLWLQECHFQWHVTSVRGHILLWKHVGFNSKKNYFKKWGALGSAYTLA